MRYDSSGTPPTTVMGLRSTPMPAVYHNSTRPTAMGIAGNTVRPDALFANINGQAIQVHGTPRASQGMNTADVSMYSPRRMASTPTLFFRSDTGNGEYQRSYRPGAPAMAPMRPLGLSWFSDPTLSRQQYINYSNPVGLPHGMASSSTASPGSVARSPHPNPPPKHTSTHPSLMNMPAQRMKTMTSTNNVQSQQNDVTRSPVFAPPHIPAPAFSSDSSAPAVSFSAIQMQIGARKHRLVSSVKIQQNGILIHPEGYPAGLLLNVQAIVKCKANLNPINYPALFLFLEKSCVHQVRNRFSLSSDDLASDNAVEIKRCITIFPRYGADAEQVMQLVKHSLKALFQRNPSCGVNFEEITDEQVLDILLGEPEGPSPPQGRPTGTAIAGAAITGADATPPLGRPTGATITCADATPRGADGATAMETFIPSILTDITQSAALNMNTSSERRQIRSAAQNQPMLNNGGHAPPAFHLTGNQTSLRTADVMRDIGQPTPGDDGDDDVVMTQEEPGVKCPYTQQVMTDPVRNTICGHNYEKSAIQEFIFRRNGNARCPYVGCENVAPLRLEELQENVLLKEYIRNNAS